MLRIYSVIVAALLLSVSAYGMGGLQLSGLGQTQGFSIYGENLASQVGGSGTSSAGNMASVEQNNNLTKIFGGNLSQSEGSMLVQGANTSGHCGSLSVQQIGGSSGTQGQLLSNTWCGSMATQGQSLEVGLQQAAEKDGGSGTAEGTQGSLAGQCQTILGNGTIMTSSQSIGAAQTANVSGNVWSDGQAGNLVQITATQTQMAN
ncbi:MAG: hypothetical protein JW787_02225 [Sedimentisphaerales bacterium]|nr:hypothetical protein [Sedimentisphaerales bacterium]